ncbi:unnamed protein product [Pipistrellus nathusii]|uniref:Uncharacterized protein n=1 Tax=Pipistrellus nathusii TaxID=59473 RepID=A0ABP0AL25_PIPNA
MCHSATGTLSPTTITGLRDAPTGYAAAQSIERLLGLQDNNWVLLCNGPGGGRGWADREEGK